MKNSVFVILFLSTIVNAFYIDKEGCQNILKGCMESSNKCSTVDKYTAYSTNSSINGYIDGIDYVYSKFGIHKSYNILKRNLLIKKVCNALVAGNNPEQVINNSYNSKKIQKIDKIAKANINNHLIIVKNEESIFNKKN